MKERITITLDDYLVQEIDTLVDNNKIQNRSHAVSVLLRKALGDQMPKKALILCGGKGTRLRPITYEIPKVMIPVQGKTIVEHLFGMFKKFGVRDIVLSVGYLKEKVKDYFGDGLRFGVNIIYIEEDEPLGTAGPIKKAKELFNEPFFVTNGDELKDVNLSDMFKMHKQTRAMATIALTTVEDPSAYGVAELSGNKILSFVEKPKKDEAPSKLISSGLYILSPEVVSLIPGRGFATLERDVFPKIASQGRLIGFPFSGQWFDTGTIERYERALKGWKGLH